MPNTLGNSAPTDASAVQWQASIAAARQGDRDAVGQLFAELRSHLRASAGAYLDQQLQAKIGASDIVQETLFKAHREFDQFQGTSRSEIVAWTQAILGQQVQAAYRRYRGTSKRSVERETQLASTIETGECAVPANYGTPSSHAMAREESQLLQAALQDLSPRHELVIRLRNELQLSFSEVAAALDCTTEAAQKLWSRAIKKLAKALSRQGAVRH